MNTQEAPDSFTCADKKQGEKLSKQLVCDGIITQLQAARVKMVKHLSGLKMITVVSCQLAFATHKIAKKLI